MTSPPPPSPTGPRPLRGCIPILCTPFFEDGSLDEESLRREIEWVIAEGASGVAALALAGEGYKLTEAERDRIAALVVETVAGRVSVVLSADGAGTEVALDRTRRAVAAGADALMVLPPSFVKPDAASLRDYYLRIAAVSDVPVMIQDAPQLTGVAMTPTFWVSLAEEAPTIRYVKAEGTPQGKTLTDTLALSGGKLEVFCGWGGLGTLDAMERGAAGSMPAPNFTRLFADIQRLWEAGQQPEATARFTAELPFVLWAMQSLDFSVTSAKRELHRRGIFSTPLLRQPATTLDDVSIRQLDAFLDARIGDGPNT